jgi:cell division protein FtsL
MADMAPMIRLMYWLMVAITLAALGVIMTLVERWAT